MKRIYYILLLGLMVLGFTSCEDFFEDKQLDYSYEITDVRTFNYTLTDGDYKTVSTNRTNVSLAQTVGVEAQMALTVIGTNKYFASEEEAETYLPAFMMSKYPQLSQSSLCNVTYNVLGTGSLVNFTLSSSDYTEIWDGRDDVSYLTPSTIGKLKNYFPTNASEGALMLVQYYYNASEPAASSSDPFAGTPESRGYYSASEAKAAYDAGTLSDKDFIYVGGTVSSFPTQTLNPTYGNLNWFVTDPTGGEFEMYQCFSIDSAKWSTFDGSIATDENGLTIEVGDFVVGRGLITLYKGTYEFANKDLTNQNHRSKLTQITKVRVVGTEVKQEVYKYDGTDWVKVALNSTTPIVVTLEDADYTAIGATSITDVNVLNTYLKQEYPYAAVDQLFVVVYKGKNGVVTGTELAFDGTDFVEVSGVVPATITLSLSDKWASSIYYKQSIAGDGTQGSIVIQDLETGGLDYVWTFDNTYGMKGSGYSSGPHVVKGWFVTPPISLKKATHPSVIFDQAMNKGPKEVSDRKAQGAVYASLNYTGDVSSCDWTLIPYSDKEEEYPITDSWDFISTGYLRLPDEYAGKENVVIGFKYESLAGQTCSTWEVKNITVCEAQ